jgi:hypothetical protein
VELSFRIKFSLSGKLSGYEIFQPSQSGKTLQTIKTNINNEKIFLLLSVGYYLSLVHPKKIKFQKSNI